MAKKNLPDEVIKGLKGFEDVFDDYLKDEERRSMERWEKEKEKKGDQYELANFLELEEKRILHIETFLTKKVAQQKQFSQSEKLLRAQKERRHQLLLKIIPELLENSAKFKINLAKLHDSHFS